MRRGCKRGQKNQALGHSRGGFTTKIHALCDALGNPMRFILTGGEKNDCTQALDLLDGLPGEAVLADKGYDADYIVDAVKNMDAIAVIPPRLNRIVQRKYDKHLYKERNLIERMFGKLKQFRRVATRYEKTKIAFMSFVLIASILLWLK